MLPGTRRSSLSGCDADADDEGRFRSIRARPSTSVPVAACGGLMSAVAPAMYRDRLATVGCLQPRREQPGSRSGCSFGCCLGTLAGMEPREVYANPPVVLVALEIRHPAAGPIPPGGIAKVKKMLSSETPLLRDTTVVNISVQAGPDGPSELVTENAPKFFSRDRAMAVTFRNEAIVIETTKYQQYERVRELVRLAFDARQAAGPIDGIDRVGLRYIDEIRVPDMEASVTPMAWAGWIDSSLLGPLVLGEDLDLKVAQLQGLAQFETTPGNTLVLRFGPREGYAVSPDADLKRTTTPPGPFFLLDIDSFWTAVDETQEPSLEWVLGLCDELHAPVRTLFERLITDRLRGEVLRGGK
jgi:uncharacterized protein (TIGR04255 family)